MTGDPKDPLTEAKILDAAEDVLRRFGPRKTNVVDVARALGVSHGSVYRHFATKAALRDAVSARWLARISDPLSVIAQGAGPAPARLEAYLRALVTAKRAKVRDDAEMFDAYTTLAKDARDVIQEHVGHLRADIAHIIADGVRDGTLAAADPAVAARMVLDATIWFHHPAHRHEWESPDADARLDAVIALLHAGLAPPGPEAQRPRGLEA